ncbi:PAS domain-containing sensor histidine kinase [Hymenobacter bucti]|uniref:histidine kinase n=1 Tax=Hymenobacter bucti TaxID=1844114 RepID=A0ABW4QNV7_9BACT
MTAAVPLADLFTAQDWLTLLDVSLTGIHLVRPLYEPNGPAIVDFALEYLNPAAQRMAGLPEQPGGTLLGHFPHTLAEGIFQYYQRVFETGEQLTYQTNYQADGLDNYFKLSARRSGEHLVVSFTDTSDQDRSAVEQALRDSQAREQRALAEAERQRAELQRVFQDVPVAMGLLRGPNFVIEWANQPMGQLWGRPVAQVQGRPHFEALPDLAGQGFEQVFADVLATGQTHVSQELPVRIAQTQQAYLGYFNVTYLPVYDGPTRITGVLCVAIDVTSQVRARQQLEQLNADLGAQVAKRAGEALALQAALLATAQRQAQEREEFYRLFEQIPVIVALLRAPEHVIHYCNPAFQRLFPGRALLGRRYAEAMPEIVAAGLIPELDRVYATGHPYYGSALPVVTTPPDGSAPHQRYYDFSYQAYREDEHIVGVSIFAYDVTEQVLARQAREAQQQLVSIVLEQAPVGIAIQTGPDLVYEFHNPSYLRMVPDRQLVGRRFFDVFPEMAGTTVETLLRHVYETGETQQEHELLIPVARADGSTELEDRYFTIVYQARRNEQGRITGILAFVMEVTEQVRARQQVQALNGALAAINQELLESNRQLTRTNVDLDTFVYTASHDLKAPITNIESIVLALRDTLPPELQQNGLVAHLLDLLNQTVARFQFTIAQLTDISRLQLAHVGPAEPVNLAAVVQDVRLDLMPAIAAAGAQLTVAVPAGLVVSFSPANLRSIVYNLLSNAVKYRAPDRAPHVQVRAQHTPQAVVLEVQDNGLGMSAVQQRQLFGLFQRLHTHVEGSGVGLYITKRLIENAGGTITVQSQPNAGTTFTVRFPS